MKIGGFQGFSLVDYPGMVCAIIFTQGCNFRCHYCHNPELVISERFSENIPIENIYDFLEKRKEKLDAVVITGGEPTLQPDIIEVIKRIKKMGFLIKIDTNGSKPKVIKNIIRSGLVDYIAMDIKSPIDKYSKITRCYHIENKITESINLIMNSEINYEFRTTDSNYLTITDFHKIANLIKGAKAYFLQKQSPIIKKVNSRGFFNLTKINDRAKLTKELANDLMVYVEYCSLR
uniref:Anaerobic ribonucleoside-triphosphate reductase activating protein n=1 Tax=candidate division CPR3 bacterium TaxID=2268181 RepID=A0A7C4M0Q7_UNCC3